LTQNAESQSQSLAHGFGSHPPIVAVVVQTKLAGQPVWLQGNFTQPCPSAATDPIWHADPLGQVYPALQGISTQPYSSAPVVPGEQTASAAQPYPGVAHERRQTFAVMEQHGSLTVLQMSFVGQSVSTVHEGPETLPQYGVVHGVVTVVSQL
jgi:hypothetical protein